MTAPTVGRIVHYRSYGTPGGEYQPECRAAMVTEVGVDPPVGPDALPIEPVGLAVYNPTGLFFHPLAVDGGCAHDEEQTKGGTWHWPCVRA